MTAVTLLVADNAAASAELMMINDRVVQSAQREMADAVRNHGTVADGLPCSYYTGQVNGPSARCARVGRPGWGWGQWCADFARWVWGQVGVSVGADLPAGHGRLDSWADSFRVYGLAKGSLTLRTVTSHTPQPGDAVVFDWDRHWSGEWEDGPDRRDGTKDIDHVGIVERATTSTIWVISGNTTNAVVRVTFSRMDTRIYAFISPR
jgi:hypothetical protein